MKLVYTALLISSFSFATELKITNKYFEEYYNPFQKVLNDKKHGDINIQVKNEILKAKVETNAQENIFTKKNESFELNKANLKDTIKNILQDNYNITSNGANILFDISNLNVYIGYLEQDGANQISNINAPISNLEISMDYSILANGKVIYKKTFKDEGNLVKYKDKYKGIFTTSDIVLTADTVEENIANFIEQSIYIAFYEAKNEIELNSKK